MREGDWLAERFEEHLSRLRAIAYRILGSPSDADDAGGVASLQPLGHQQRGQPRQLAHYRWQPVAIVQRREWLKQA
jgi:hypothetical protein